MCVVEMGEGEGEGGGSYLSSVEPRFSISLVTSAISSFSRCRRHKKDKCDECYG